ncbi:nuclear receptor-interacting protein 1 [Etheostoma spectabile]|uniref:nuclear receptor-interacting protein 1 n=1 Tax=Etheostoma spectabile TaxID=54343 RepID=UPI0013AEE5AA|nr:nuclear receptor-interacting protein 1 [Etheostoma spectabile]XP_032390482.1 nuclear receptor-interacting protein 1 [Etheostoma spectabile]XP_032390483.1 nuclear receptor-interacting protein 1 [Etheostoma spectabile]XP_032390484.1 nuclear receptor-interacting protein 1 [Etheostoma spectabile]XP_032390485.1 nuclear receptor-interacting protein 1 [Etheostoma spectabile]XP_032390486.1 nuclear receptor-interacting protein 1 [Etheostoma spectabile]
MTHGEEPGPETHKDSAVLTYLEGLLMHPVVAGPGATASGRSEAAHSNQEQADKVCGPFQLPNHGPTAPKGGTNGPTLGSSQHLKKARLLRSGAWNDPGNQRMSSPPMELNGQGGGLQNGTLEGSPHAGESTLLASLLQSFSSRLQSVAMSQHSNKPPNECSSPSKAPPTDKEPLPVYGTASSRLKGLMRKSKLQNHSNTPYSRRGHSQDRPPESPRSAHSATPPAAPATAESVSCAERLKAVANMVKIRSSPAPSPSPKPSVACSQLALLLSSEAHLQQYSREHALKAQLSGRSASERLAAMANQQHGPDKRPPSVGGSLPGATDTLSSLTTQNGMTTTTTVTTTLPRTALSSPQSPSLLRGHSQSSPPTPPHAPNPTHSQAPREKRGVDSRPTRPPQTCSSLLLLLLNNHNNQKQLTKNGHLEDSCGILPPSGSSSVTSDSECSIQERSLAKDSSDAESSYWSCSPIDLSMRSRASTQYTGPKTSTPSSSFSSFSSSTSTLSSSTTVFSSTPVAFSPQASAQPSTNTAFSPSSTVVSSVSTAISTSSSSSISTSSLDKLTESLLKKWKPEPSGSNVCKNKEPEVSPDRKSHSKVTLMQLLLERRNNEMVNKSIGNQDLPLDITMATMSREQPKGLVPWEETRTESPINRPVAPAQPLYSLSRDPSGALSPYSYSSPHVQSSPLDLCKSKAFPAEKASEPAFSASKLLQNLAQCGTASSSPPIPSSKGLGQELDASRPLALLERLNAPIHRTTTTPLSDRPSGSGTPFSQKEASPSSQIENLLERRTVLQLLLGTGSATATVSRKDRPSGRRSVEVAGGCYDKSPSASIVCDSSNGPPLDVKVKTELTEEVGQSSAMSEDSSGRKRHSGYEKNSPLSDSQQHLKTEPQPAEVIAKYGLLSQLLKQQTATYYTSSAMQAESQPRQVKEEQSECPSPSPKKRRLCSDRTDSLHNTSSPRAVDSGDMNIFASSAVQEEPEWPRNVKEEDAPPRSPPSETLTRESRGFNVLKQLLLSDNCLKELSQQPRGTPNPSVLQANGKANGSILSQPAHNHSFLHLPGWQPRGSLNSGLPSNLRPLPTPPAGDSPIRSPWSRHPAPWPVTQKRDPPTLVKQEPESPVRWSSQENEEEEGCDSNLDSPRLSRSNPILYYMLQKGSIQLRKEVREQAEGTQSVVRVKEEPISDMHAYEHSLSSIPQSPKNNDKHSHESQGLSHSYE